MVSNEQLLYRTAGFHRVARHHHAAGRRDVPTAAAGLAVPANHATANHCESHLPGGQLANRGDTVTTPLEQQLNGVQGMIYMSSVSANDGTSTITLTFDVGYSPDIAAVDVQNRVSQATGQLPAKDAVVLPQAALGSSQIGKFVYVMGADNKAAQRYLSLGPTEGELAEGTKGRTEGDRIITGNLQKLSAGKSVRPTSQGAQRPG